MTQHRSLELELVLELQLETMRRLSRPPDVTAASPAAKRLSDGELGAARAAHQPSRLPSDPALDGGPSDGGSGSTTPRAPSASSGGRRSASSAGLLAGGPRVDPRKVLRFDLKSRPWLHGPRQQP